MESIQYFYEYINQVINIKRRLIVQDTNHQKKNVISRNGRGFPKIDDSGQNAEN